MNKEQGTAPPDLDKIARRLPSCQSADIWLTPAERDALVAAARIGLARRGFSDPMFEQGHESEYDKAVAAYDKAMAAARRPEVSGDVAGQVAWLKGLAEKGGKGAVALGRTATTLEALARELAGFKALEAHLPPGYAIGDDATVPLAIKLVEVERERDEARAAMVERKTLIEEMERDLMLALGRATNAESRLATKETRP